FTHYSNSQDYDSLLFGCPNIIQNLSKSMRRKVHGKWQYQKIQPAFINLQQNLSNLRISLFQLVDIGILIGSDYFPGISGFGPKKALALIRKYKSLETLILKEYNNYDFHGLNPDIIKNVRKIFLFPDVNERIDNLIWNPPNKSRIFNLMCEEHHLNKERVENNIEKFKRNYEICRDYFLNQKEQSKTVQITLDNLL
ncbi:MAG: hypothetical protein ACFE9S_15350, partial [Candidatus Hermodarchaeota archaeon]